MTRTGIRFVTAQADRFQVQLAHVIAFGFVLSTVLFS